MTRPGRSSRRRSKAAKVRAGAANLNKIKAALKMNAPVRVEFCLNFRSRIQPGRAQGQPPDYSGGMCFFSTSVGHAAAGLSAGVTNIVPFGALITIGGLS